MRDELEKLATRSADGRDHEEMSRRRFRQTLKDLPVVIGGSALGYGVGKTIGDSVAKRFVKTEAGRARVRGMAPMAASLLTSAGAYALGQQRAIMRERRDAADAKSKTSAAAPSSRSYLVKNSPQFSRMQDRSVQAEGHSLTTKQDKPGSRGPANMSFR